MEFNNIVFLAIFPVIVLLYFAIPKRYRIPWLLFVSYVLYASVSKKYTVMLVLSTLSTYVAGLLIQKAVDAGEPVDGPRKRSRGILLAAILLNVGLLGFFKYTNFLLSILQSFHAPISGLADLKLPLSIVVPVGISFYTFQVVGYLIDVYRQKSRAETNLVRYALFVSFFPKVTVGPIERSDGFLRQLKETASFDYARIRHGLLIMLWGYFCKIVIADRCAVVANYVFKNFQHLSGMQTFVGSLAYTLQIYTDFMGYTLIAIGAAEIFGYHLMQNFQRPYFATSIKDFWRRWHISLSLWLRDYVYIPLGGSRCSRRRKYLNVMITFLVSGIWHGANYTFIFWGLMHGALQVLEDWWQPRGERLCGKWHIDRTSFSHHFFLVLKTFLLVNFAWIFFRSPSISEAVSFVGKALHLYNGAGALLQGSLTQLGLNTFNYVMLATALMLLFAVSWYEEHHGEFLGWLSRQGTVFRYLVYWVIVAMITFSLNLSTQEFIYLKF